MKPILKKHNFIVTAVLIVITFGFYFPIWFLRRSKEFNSLVDTKIPKSELYLLLGLCVYPVAVALLEFFVGFSFFFDIFDGMAALIPVVLLVAPIYIIVLTFRIRDILYEYVELKLGRKNYKIYGLFSIFLTIIYLDYKMNQIYKIHNKCNTMEEDNKARNGEYTPNFLINEEVPKQENMEHPEEEKLTVKDLFTETYTKLLKVRALFVFFSFLIAGMGEILFLGETKGLGFFIFTIIYIVGFASIAKITKQLRNYWAFGLAIPMFSFALASFLYSNAFVNNWVLYFVYILYILYPLFLTLQNPNNYRFSLSQIPIFNNLLLPFQKVSFILNDLKTIGSVDMDEGKKNKLMKVGMGIMISVPILIIFGLLFYYADAVFAEWTKKVVEYLDIDIHWEDLGKIVRIFIIGMVMSALYYVFLSKNHILGNKNDKVFRLDDIIVSIVLGFVNLLFAVFVFIQFTYLFGKKEFVMANDMVFAEYARSGFFQLVWVIILATIMLLVIYRSAVFHKAKQIVGWLQVGLIAQILVIGMSAVRRMNVYQDAYGYTVLRLYVEWFIYFACIILLLAMVSIIIKWKFRYFLYSSICAGFIAISVVSLMNIHYYVAKENVSRFVNNDASLDIAYLDMLGFDAVPAMEVLFHQENFKKLSVQNKVDIANLFDKAYAYFNNKTSTGVGYKYYSHKALRIVYGYDTKDFRAQLDQAKDTLKDFEKNRTEVLMDSNGDGCIYPSVTKNYKDKSVTCTLKKIGDTVYVIASVNANRESIYIDSKKEEKPNLTVNYDIYRKQLNAEVIDYALVKQYTFEYNLLDATKQRIEDFNTKYETSNKREGVEYLTISPTNNFIMLRDGSIIEVDDIYKTIIQYEIEIENNFFLKKKLLTQNINP